MTTLSSLYNERTEIQSAINDAEFNGESTASLTCDLSNINSLISNF